MTFPVSFLGRLIVFSENARAGIDRIDTIIDGKDEEAVSGEIRNPLSPPAEVDAITFSRGSKVILNDMSFRIRKGEFVAITGSTGSGKSTLINMLPRLYDPDSGTISYNGVVYDKFTLPEIRERIAVVPQEISLLSGSIRENIAFGKGEFTDQEVVEAAKIAHIDDFIDSLPDKYETIVGERGITLSGGQKQRVAIARAVIMMPELLIFDDATSSLDAETELDIFNSIRKKLRSTSVIIISLRETGLKFADRVLVVDNGNLEDVTDSRRNLIDASRGDGLAGGG
jgi:ABC-type multidrug transport system fused ATPase/permease subunit